MNIIDGIFLIKIKENNKQKLKRWLGGAKNLKMVNIRPDLWFEDYQEDVFYIEESDRLIMLDELAEKDSGTLILSFEYYGSYIPYEKVKEMSDYLGVEVKVILSV